MNGSTARTAAFFFAMFAIGFSAAALLRPQDAGPGGANAVVFSANPFHPYMQMAAMPDAREFSDVVMSPGTSTAIIVEDESKDSFTLVDLAPAGSTDSPARIIPFPPDFYLKDMEGVAVDRDGFIYVVSSHSLNSAGAPRRGSALARTKFRADGSLASFDSIADLRPWLESAMPEIARVASLSADEGGLNIEGLAVDPARNRLLMGLRGPLFDGRAAVVPVRLPSAGMPFRREFMSIDSPVVLRGIRGFGIRSISRDDAADGFWILTGGSSKTTKNKFALRFWNGRGAYPVHFEDWNFPKKFRVNGAAYKLHPEGVCAVRTAGVPPYLLVVNDGAPVYFKMSMPEGY